MAPERPPSSTSQRRPSTRQQQRHQRHRARAARPDGADDADADGGGDPSDSPVAPRRLLALINRATKYGVSLAVLLVVLWTGPSSRACWAVAGSVASSGACKLLKSALNHARPAGAPRADPGMPSSHANSLAFLAATAALELARIHDALAGAGAGGGGAMLDAARGGRLAQLAVLGAGAFLSWLRVCAGFHSPAQVWAGAALGGGGALAWHALSGPALGALAAAAGSEEAAGFGLRLVAGAAGVAFAAGNARSWLPAAAFLGSGGGGGGGGGAKGRAG